MPTEWVTGNRGGRRFSEAAITLTTRNAAGTIARVYSAYPPIRAAMQEVVEKWAAETIRIVQETCAKDTWFMHDHARYVLSKDRLAYEAGWFNEDFAAAGHRFYPIFVEFGTRFMAAQPSLFPANEMVRPRMLADARVQIQAAIAHLRGRVT
jgi:hypothetical protein